MHDTNCPNCGAIINGPKCEYCGTIFSNFTSRDCEIKKIERENLYIRNQIEIARLQDLYTKALQAMRRYAF